jgi:hypothetical protein
MNCITVLSSSLPISAYLARNLNLERIVASRISRHDGDNMVTGQTAPDGAVLPPVNWR